MAHIAYTLSARRGLRNRGDREGCIDTGSDVVRDGSGPYSEGLVGAGAETGEDVKSGLGCMDVELEDEGGSELSEFLVRGTGGLTVGLEEAVTSNRSRTRPKIARWSGAGCGGLVYCGSCGAAEILFESTLISRFGCIIVSLMLKGATSYASDCKCSMLVASHIAQAQHTSQKPSKAQPAAQ